MKKIVFLSLLSSLLMAQIPNDLYRECSQGVSSSCYKIALKQLSITSSDYNPSLGRNNLNTACLGNYAPACLAYGKYYNSVGDYSLARNYYKKSCDLGSSEGCYYYNKDNK